MGHIFYVNGRYLPRAQASVHVEDRGYQFADGVYEMFLVHAGRLIGQEAHLNRLGRSLGEVRIPWPMGRRPLELVMKEVLRRNGVQHGLLYLQVTRGVAPRNHVFPPSSVCPGLVITAGHLPPFNRSAASRGVAVITTPDERWKRPDIKSLSLLPNVLAKQKAWEAGAYEAWLIDSKGQITEGAASNAWIVTRGGTLVTRQAGCCILEGVTRGIVTDLIEKESLVFEERPFTIAEAQAAREAFLTSASSCVKPVTSIDGKLVGQGEAGPLTQRLVDLFADHLDLKPETA